MTVMAVTGFVEIPNHPRSVEEYHDLARPLRELSREVPFLMIEGELHQCWLWHYLHAQPNDFTWSVADNPKKNSLAYHCVQANKTEWVEIASRIDPFSDVFVWVDWGVMHIPGMSIEIIRDFLARAANEKAIAVPGCWDADYIYNDDYPCWRFAGGCFIVPREYVRSLNDAMKQEYIDWFEQTGNISWEVNTLSRLERMGTDLPIWHYTAGHDSSLFTNYQQTENADGKQIATTRLSA